MLAPPYVAHDLGPVSSQQVREALRGTRLDPQGRPCGGATTVVNRLISAAWRGDISLRVAETCLVLRSGIENGEIGEPGRRILDDLSGADWATLIARGTKHNADRAWYVAELARLGR